MLHETNKNNKILLIQLVIPLTILSKVLQFTVLPEKYFYDSLRMLSMLTGSGEMQEWEGGYITVVNIFNKINFFNFTTLIEWAVFIASIFSIVLIIMIAVINEPDITKSIFILASIGLLNIYVFNISKEIIQFFIFMLVYFVIKCPKIRIWFKMALIILIFYFESTFFRSYYLFIGALSLIVYFILIKQMKSKKSMSLFKLLFIMLIIFISIYGMITVLKFISPKDYNVLINISENHENKGAVTAINNLIEVNGNQFLFMINFIINGIRMMFPIELMTKGVFYFPFVFYQIFILYYLGMSLKNINKNSTEINILSVSVILGFLLGSFTFEPDFGSFVRHEAATFPVLHLLALNKEEYIKCKEEVRYEK